MRWLFLLLLMTNIAYISWEINKPSDDAIVKKTAVSHIPPLVLVTELDLTKNEVIETVDKTEAVEEENIPVESDTKVEIEVVKKDSIEVVTDVKPVKTVVEPPALIAGSCYTLGPFRELDELRVFTRSIIDYVVDVSFRSREEREVSLFWVYLEPESDSAAAHKLSKRLISKKIRDYYIISSGEHQYGISLGHFKDKERASSHAKRLKKLGFNPVVETVFKNYVIYWLDYKHKQGRQIPDEIFTKLMNDRMSKLNRECI